MTAPAGVVTPPAGWPKLVGVDVMTNLDHRIDGDVAACLRAEDFCAFHAAVNFQGVVWFVGDRWHEQVWVRHVPQSSFSADTLEALMKVVNDEYGWA